jgi:hypothetical protein
MNWQLGGGTVVAAHSATVAARWQQRGGCGGSDSIAKKSPK